MWGFTVTLLKYASKLQLWKSLLLENNVTYYEILCLHRALFQNKLSNEFPTVYKPLKPIILRTGIFLGAHVVYAQQELDFDYCTAL